MAIEESDKHRMSSALISWYDKNKRTMPWRGVLEPYLIWVSEVMLQQTQVDTVEAYYNRFIGRFPTVQDLAAASQGEVMKVWEGLGYYARARRLHRAAQIVVKEFDGKIPGDYESFLSLPGVGRYTAGAVMSIAFGRRVPVLDGNVIRLLSRIFHITDDVTRDSTRKHLWSLVESILPDERIEDFNQALMELGALVCRPKNPSCPSCPLSDLCEANRLSLQTDLPVKRPKKPLPHLDVTAGVIYKDEKFLITLRPPKGLLGGLWEFPGGKKEQGERLEDCLKREIKEELGIEIEVCEPIVRVKHAYTHFRITLHVYRCRYVLGRVKPVACDDFRWISKDELDGFAFPAADRKVIDCLKQQGKEG